MIGVFCPDCRDVVIGDSEEVRKCSCGQCGLIYKDTSNETYVAEVLKPSVVFGIDNVSFLQAYNNFINEKIITKVQYFTGFFPKDDSCHIVRVEEL